MRISDWSSDVCSSDLAGGLLAACTPQEELHPTFGHAVHHNMSLHIIHPAPTYSTLGQVPDFDAPRAAGAQQRYDDGEVIPPERLRTSVRSEEHTSELQSLMRISYADFCLKQIN